jgi:hypothetical protein
MQGVGMAEISLADWEGRETGLKRGPDPERDDEERGKKGKKGVHPDVPAG